MTLDRVLLQKSQERTAPASEEYQVKQEEEREKKKKEMKKQQAEQKKLELRKQLELELGEGFEAQIDTRHITNPVAAAAIKKKSLVKKILNKMKPKSPGRNREGVEADNDKPLKPITAMEARTLARKALDASKQRRLGNADPAIIKVSDIERETTFDSFSFLNRCWACRFRQVSDIRFARKFRH